jgi:hypothetical protein
LNVTSRFGHLLRLVVLALAVLCANVSKSAERELIRDPHFQGGFILLSVEPGMQTRNLSLKVDTTK